MSVISGSQVSWAGDSAVCYLVWSVIGEAQRLRARMSTRQVPTRMQLQCTSFRTMKFFSHPQGSFSWLLTLFAICVPDFRYINF